MAYAAESDLDATFGPEQVDLVSISDRTKTRDHVKIASALNTASGQIDAYLSRRYQLPVSPAPAGVTMLTDLCCDIGFWRLASTADRMTEIIKDRYDKAIRFLVDVAAAKADIAMPPVVSPSGAPNASVITPNEAILQGGERLFSDRRRRLP